MLRDLINGQDIAKLEQTLRNESFSQDDLDEALLAAISVGVESTRLLLQFGANPTCRPETRPPPIHWAVEDGEPDTVRALVEAGADVDLVHDGWTPLHHAIDLEIDIASNSNFEEQPCDLTCVVLELGADPSIRDEEGLTALESAQQRRHFQAAAIILHFLKSDLG